MKISPAKENILKKVRNALSQSVQLPFPNAEGNSTVFIKEHDGLEMKFAEEFARLQGKFIFCTSKNEVVDNLVALVTSKEWDDVYCQTPSLMQQFQLKQFPFMNNGDM